MDIAILEKQMGCVTNSKSSLVCCPISHYIYLERGGGGGGGGGISRSNPMFVV